MKFKVLLSAIATTLVLGGYPAIQLSQAKPATQVTRSVWKKFNSAEGRFSILMPGTPKQIKQTLKLQNGTVNLRAFVVERKQEGVAYLVAYTDFPSSRVRQANVQQAFDAARDQAVKGSQGKLLSQRNMKLGGYPGREIQFVNPTGDVTKVRMYFVNKRLYQVAVVTEKDKQKRLPRSVAGFLNSFKLASR